MVAVLDHGDVDIDDVAVLELLVGRNAVADDVVDRGADRARKTAVIERRRHHALLVDHEIVADVVELLGGNAGLDMRLDHAQHIGRKAAGDAHLVDFFGGFDRDTHKIQLAGC